MSKQERRRVRLAASLGLTVLMSSAILGGMAPLTAHAAEVGSEPTTTEVSPMITAPEHPSDAVTLLPAGDEAATTESDDTAEENTEAEITAPEAAPTTPATSPQVEEAKAEAQAGAEPIAGDNAADTQQTAATTRFEIGELVSYWGDVRWSFNQGVLTLEGGVGEDTGMQSPWAGIANTVESVVITGDITAPADSSFLFAGFSQVTHYEGLNHLKLSQATTTRNMFADNQAVSSLDVASWDMSNVGEMWSMFDGCISLTQLELENWNVNQVYDLDRFLYGTRLESVDLSNWHIAETYLQNTFSAMPELKRLNIANFDIVRTPSANQMIRNSPQLAELTVGDQTVLEDNVDLPVGQHWQGERTGHQFSRIYGGGYADTYRLVEGILSTTIVHLFDDLNAKQVGWQVLTGAPGATIALATMKIPHGYELTDPAAAIDLSANGDREDGFQFLSITLKRVHKTTTRTIVFEGLENEIDAVVQTIAWDWDWSDAVQPNNSRLFFFDGLVHTAQGGYDEYPVPEIEGYEANLTVVEAKSFEAELSDLPADETITVTYTKLDSGDGDDQNPDPSPSQPDTDNGGGSGGSTGTGSTGTGSIGGGQLTNLSTGGSTTTNSNQALPQTGSQVASGLTLFGLGLLGLLGFTKRRKRD